MAWSSSETEIEELGPNKQSGSLLKWIVGLALAILLTVVCAGATGYFAFTQIRSQIDADDLAELTGPLFAGDPILNQIAYIGNDRNVWLVTPDGQERSSLTDDGRGYRFPTWAPDSRRVAFIGPDNKNNPVLYISSAAESTPTVLFDNPDAAPFYLYWAPDSQSITFLTQEVRGLSMRKASVNNPKNQQILEEGAPFYWVWSPSGERLLMHVGGSRDLSDEAHISLLDNRDGAERVELKLAPGGFQAPVWSSDGQSFFYTAIAEDDVTALFKTTVDTLEQTVVKNLDGFAYLVLSPDDRRLAYLQIERGNRPPFGTAYLVDTDGKNHQKLTDRLVGSMYWSPDGRKLAILTFAQSDDGSTAKVGGLAAPLSQDLALRWWIYDVVSEELEPLISFTPTADFLQTVPYFDQYHLSLTFWSPDSRYFVVTKEQPNSSGGAVWVVDTTGEEAPQQIGEGTIAVWSWR